MSEPMIGEIKAVGFPWCPYGYAFANGATMQIQANNALYALIGTYFGGDGRSTFGLPNLQSRVGVGIYTGGAGTQFMHYQIANNGGNEAVALTLAQMPQHNHQASTSVNATTTVTPTTSISPSLTGLSATTTITALGAPTTRASGPSGNFLTIGSTTVSATATLVQIYAASGNGTPVTMAAGMATTSVTGTLAATANTTATATTNATANTTVGNNGASSPFDNRAPFLALNYLIAINGVFPQRN